MSFDFSGIYIENYHIVDFKLWRFIISCLIVYIVFYISYFIRNKRKGIVKTKTKLLIEYVIFMMFYLGASLVQEVLLFLFWNEINFLN